MSVIFPANRLVRTASLKYGLGVEFWVKSSVDWVVSVRDPVGGIVFWMTNNPGLRVRIEDVTLSTVVLDYPVTGSPAWLADGLHHHVRFSIRRRAPYLAFLSLDGSYPVSVEVPNVPQVFGPYPAYAQQFDFVVSATPGGTVFDNMRVWDGWHGEGYVPPTDGLPAHEQWIPKS